MSRRAYQARRTERQHRARHNNAAGIELGECLACDQRRPLIASTGLCQACTTHEHEVLSGRIGTPLPAAYLGVPDATYQQHPQ